MIGLNPNFPGSTHDAAIWGASRICHYLREEYVQGVRNQWLLGNLVMIIFYNIRLPLN